MIELIHSQLGRASPELEPASLAAEVEEIDRPHRAHAVERAVAGADARPAQRVLGQLRAHVHRHQRVFGIAGRRIGESNTHLPKQLGALQVHHPFVQRTVGVHLPLLDHQQLQHDALVDRFSACDLDIADFRARAGVGGERDSHRLGIL